MAKHLMGICLLVLASTAYAGSAYKWVDKYGVTHYSEEPPDDNSAQQLDLSSGTTTHFGSDDDNGASSRIKRDAEPSSQSNKTQAREDALKRQRIAQARQRLCDRGRHDLEILQMEKRVYIPGKNGDRNFLDEDQRAQEIKKATQKIADNCNRR